ncbi:hypothetical protein BGX23_009492 [Mortierella sp. AD031]|nr:hypothetical protein BGX23_009492 [Mortierella sp. AD031]
MATQIQNNPPEVLIPNLGAVRGAFDKDGKVAKFFNIPFGLVEERWRPAVKPKPWDGIRDATKLGPMPPQQTDNNPFLSMFLGVPDKYNFEEAMSERDCLNCNIFMPASAVVGSTEKLPVLVWVHGGGLRNGGNSIPLYDCSELVLASIELNKPMVVVAINYRLNYLGFISSKELILDAQEHAKTIPEDDRKWYDLSVGNWGLLDQILALLWVQNHISALSGNAKRVTIMGESGGAIAVSHLHLIPQCRGLFERSIMQSGGALALPTMYAEQEGQQLFDRLRQLFDIPAELSPLEKVARLRKVPAKRFTEDMNKTAFLLFRPTLGNVVFSKGCRLTVGDASYYDPGLEWVITGNTRDEGTMFVGQVGATILTEYDPFVARICEPDDRDQFNQIFGIPTTDADVAKICTRIVGNGGYRFAALQVSEAIKAHPTCQLTRYHFDRHTEKIEAMLPGMGAHHGVDMFFTFGNEICLAILSEEEKSMIRKVQGVWIEFVAAESPKAAALIPKVVGSVLPGAADAKEEAIVFGADLKISTGVVERISAEEVGFWKRSSAFEVKQAQLGKAADHGFDLAKGIKAYVVCLSFRPFRPFHDVHSDQSWLLR